MFDFPIFSTFFFYCYFSNLQIRKEKAYREVSYSKDQRATVPLNSGFALLARNGISQIEESVIFITTLRTNYSFINTNYI
jgi:hypothetical protein